LVVLRLLPRGAWRSRAWRSAAFRASSAAKPAGPPAFQSRDWRPGLAAGSAGAMGWPGFRDATLDDEATGAWLHGGGAGSRGAVGCSAMKTGTFVSMGGGTRAVKSSLSRK
jgi:hypothetical protein